MNDNPAYIDIEGNLNSTTMWETYTDGSLATSEVHIWKVDIANSFNYLFRKYRSILNEQEYQKAKTYFKEQNVRNFLTGRIALKLLCSKYSGMPAYTIRFSADINKPRLLTPVTLKYNLSYSGNHILISFGNCETGIDAEHINSRFDYEAMLPICFSEEERNHIKSNSKSCEDFYLQWTRKEAILKFTGQGLFSDLACIPSLNGTHRLDRENLKVKENIKLVSFHVSDKEVGSIVYPDNGTDLKYYEWANEFY